MSRRFFLIGAIVPLALIVALGLASGILQTPGRAYWDPSGLFAPSRIAVPAVVVAGLADGINPCAFTLLLLLAAAIASLYGAADGGNLRSLRVRLVLFGGTFILGIFLTYLGLGTGLLTASRALSQSHAGTRLGALIAVLLGLWMIKDFMMPGWGPRLSAPAAVGRLVRTWSPPTSLTATFGLGVLVGLCTVPCSGAIYVAIISMLALQENFAQALLYLVLYNVTFVLPLVGILGVAASRPTLNRVAHWNLHHRDRVRLVLGSSVVVLGLTILATV